MPLISMESDIWPAMILETHAQGIKPCPNIRANVAAHAQTLDAPKRGYPPKPVFCPRAH